MIVGLIHVLHLQLNAQVLLIGVSNGLTYGVLALGIVLIYKTARVLNLAQGDLGAFIAGLIPWFVSNIHMSYWLALPLALVIAAVCGALLEILFLRRLAKVSRLIVMMATIGAANAFFIFSLFIPVGTNLATSVFPLPFHVQFSLGPLSFPAPEVVIIVFVPVVCLLLAAFFRYTNIGLASRAAVDNEDSTILAGVSIRRISLMVWVLAAVLAGVAGILYAPLQSAVQREQVGPDLLERAIGAAMLGGMTSFTGAMVGGVAIGLIEAIALFNFVSQGVADLALLVVIVLALAFRRRDVLLRRSGGVAGDYWSLTGSVKGLSPRIAASRPVRAFHGGALALYIGIALVVGAVATNTIRDDFASGFVFAIMAMSLVVLTGYCGQISIGQSAFAAVGAYLGGRLAELGWNWWLALLAAAVVGFLLALVAGVPALRIRGIYLAILTLAFATATGTWLVNETWLVAVNKLGQTSTTLNRPHIGPISFFSEQAYYNLCLVALILAAIFVWRLRNSELGRRMRAIRENEIVAESQGISPTKVKLQAFAIAGMLAAVGGFLYAGLLVDFSDPTIFQPELSLTIVLLAIIGGITTISGSIMAGIGLLGVGGILSPLLPGLVGGNVTLIFGSFGFLLVLIQNPNGLSAQFLKGRTKMLMRLGLIGAEEAVPLTTATPSLAGAQGRPRENREVDHRDETLAIEALRVRVAVGEHVILDDVSISARQGEVVGLIGPNGAGKSTLFDVLGGQLRPDRGSVLLENRDVTSLSADKRARRGLARSFPQANLYPDLSVLEVIEISLERSHSPWLPAALLGMPGARRVRAETRRRAYEILDFMGLDAAADSLIAELSTGMRRFAELATIVASGAKVVLLDEPTAGIAQREVERFRPILQEIRDYLDATVLIVEHDFPTIAEIADRIYVLDSGALIAEGSSEDLRANERVIGAYLGTTAIRAAEMSKEVRRGARGSETGVIPAVKTD